ncbi:spore germination protein [Paenibacillus sp. RC67]|uniref:spore germination protein n=1 Tax=Paenibacillus sp. RC67 TaxID=3039392 RepID=UPI0024AE305C|nr:spore germination protein [Paenibacillus sp. RC67]
MVRWKKMKKYFIADLEADPNRFSLGHWGDQNQSEEVTPLGSSEAKTTSMPQLDDLVKDYGLLSTQLSVNMEWFKQHFSYPQNHGLIVRQFLIGHSTLLGAAIYLEGQVDWEHLNRTTLLPLMTMHLPEDTWMNAETIMGEIITECQVSSTDLLRTIVNDILKGSAAIFVDGMDEAVIVQVQGWEKKAIDAPRTETVVRGSNEGFTEDIETNVSMIRRRLRTPDLMVEWGRVGTISRTEIAMIYLKSIANEEIVSETRKRIAAIQYDYIGDSGMIEQFIEDHPNAIYPNVLGTERPDRVAAHISEGYVGIIVDNSPFALIVPAHFPLFLQTAEDANLRWPYSTFLRIIRTIGFFISLYLPAIYVGVANFHQEMIPTPLIVAIAGTRETVPIPVAAEAFMLESMFELIREAGVRIPSVIGPTIGIVGALILGQAAVQANIVSPIVVIITATTALASYTIPNYNMQFAARILRFVYLLAASFLGLVGVVLLSMMLLSFRVGSSSFGVPILAPITPHRQSNDTMVRGALRNQRLRPFSIRPKIINKIPTNTNNPQKEEKP